MIFAFDDFELDSGKVELRRNGEPVPIEPKVFSLINLLVENQGRVVSKDELIEKIWDGRFVSDAAVSSSISAARKALGDDGKQQKYLKTLHGRGVRFMAEVSQLGGPAEAPIVSEAPGVSIAVLPFDNMSAEREYEYLVDGIVEDITTSLARAGWLFVMSRNSSFAYKGKAIEVKQVGRELGVRYLLEGSIRRSASSLRITAQLIEAETGGHIWADKFDGEIGDVFELQDRITESVVGAIEPGLRRAEMLRTMAKPTSNLDAYDHFLRGLHEMYASTRASLTAAVEFLENAVELDPGYELAKAYLALALAMRDTPGWGQPEDAGRALELARHAIRAAEDNPVTLRTAGYALSYFAEKTHRASGDDLDIASAALERSLSLHPSSAQALNSYGFIHLWSGRTGEAAACFGRAMEISPRDQEMGYICVGLATAQMILGHDQDALQTALQAIAEMPENGSAHRLLIAALVRLDRLAEARAAAERLLEIIPDTKLADVKPVSNPPEFAEQFLADLRAAGYPE